MEIVQIFLRLLIITTSCVTASSSATRSILPQANQQKLLGEVSSNVVFGFDLTDAYCTATLLNTATSEELYVRVNGSDEYHELMHRLSLPESQHPAPPYDSFEDEWDDRSRQDLRWVRKFFGFPASKDVKIISELLRAVKTEAENLIDTPITEAIVSSPNFVALYDEDITDSMEYLHIKALDTFIAFRQPRAYTTAWAGNHHGLCQNYTDYCACRAENQRMSSRCGTLIIMQTSDAFSSGVTYTEQAYTSNFFKPSSPVTDFNLGSKHRYHNGNEQFYWEGIRSAATFSMMHYDYRDMPIKYLLMYGESAGDAELREFLLGVVEDIHGSTPEVVGANNPVFAASKGAAEFAKRAPYAQWPSTPDRKPIEC